MPIRRMRSVLQQDASATVEKMLGCASGPTTKHAGYLKYLAHHHHKVAGRSANSSEVQALIERVVMELKRVLAVPEGYALPLIPGSCSGAMEATLWSVLGDFPVHIFVYETFGRKWADIVTARLQLRERTTLHEAKWGELPIVGGIDPTHDAVLVMTGTVSGVRFPNLDFISADRMGLVLADASATAFCGNIDWQRVDATCISFQKGLGSEAQYGAVVLSPRALERLRGVAPRNVPRLLDLRLLIERLDAWGTSSLGGAPSALCFLDLEYALRRYSKGGGLPAAITKTTANGLKVGLPQGWNIYERISARAATRFGVFDTLGYREGTPSFRPWCGPTLSQDAVLSGIDGLIKAASSELDDRCRTSN